MGINNGKVVEVQFVKEGPVIDGVIEDIWNIADSATNFIQVMPYEKYPSTEKTVVYVLQDEYNLYVAFRAYTEKNKCVVCLGGKEDNVTVYLDPFGSKNTEYYKVLVQTIEAKTVLDWLGLDRGNLVGKVLSLPTPEDIGAKFQGQSIVEYYSR